MKFLVSSVFLVLSVSLFAQKIDELEYLLKQNVSVHNDSVNITTQILVEEQAVKINDETLYYWYKAGRIHQSRGGLAGDVLHGNYVEYFENGNIKIQGVFFLGTKDETWKEWYSNGELKTIQNWKKGVLHGESKMFGLNGKVSSLKKYKNGEEQLEGENKNKKINFKKNKMEKE